MSFIIFAEVSTRRAWCAHNIELSFNSLLDQNTSRMTIALIPSSGYLNSSIKRRSDAYKAIIYL